MHTRKTFWILVALVVAAVWILPGEVEAADWLVRKHYAVDESEPEVPNVTAPQDQSLSTVETRIVESRRIVPTPANRSQNLLLRLLRFMRSLNFGGLAR